MSQSALQSALVTRVHRATLFLHGVLTVALFALVAGRGTVAHLLLAVGVSLPLLATWPGLLRQRAYTASWASMLVAFYCAMLLAEAYMLPKLKVALLALAVVAVLDFVALMLYAKAKKTADAMAARTKASAT